MLLLMMMMMIIHTDRERRNRKVIYMDIYGTGSRPIRFQKKRVVPCSSDFNATSDMCVVRTMDPTPQQLKVFDVFVSVHIMLR